MITICKGCHDNEHPEGHPYKIRTLLDFGNENLIVSFLLSTTVRVSFLPYDRTSWPFGFEGSDVKRDLSLTMFP